jgi:hypothetical protein
MRAAAIGLALIALAGCGGGDHKPAPTRPSHQQSASNDRGRGEPDKGGEEQDKGGVSALPLEDRRAFLQIGAASSNLRSAASLMLVKGFAPSSERATLLRLRQSVRLLKPRDPGLRRLRAETLRALGRGLRAPRAARQMLTDANRIRQGLTRYSKAQPAIGAIAPD